MLLQGNIYGVVGCWYLVVGIGFQPKLPTTSNQTPTPYHYIFLFIDILWRSLNFPWQAPEVLTKDGAYTIQEERDVRNAMQLCSESFDL